MRHDERQGVFVRRAQMLEVDAEAVDLGTELGVSFRRFSRSRQSYFSAQYSQTSFR